MTSDAGRSGLRPPGDSAQQPARVVRPLWRRGRMWLGLALSLGSLVLAMRGIDKGEIAATLRTTHLGWLAAAMLVVLVGSIVKGARWRLLFYDEAMPGSLSTRQSLGVFRLTRIWMAGAALNLAVPAPRSGDLARVYLVGEAGVSKALTLGTLAAEKMLDLALLAFCFLGLVFFVAIPDELRARQGPTIGVAVSLLLFIAVVLWQRDRLLVWTQRLLQRLPGNWSGQAVNGVAKTMQGLDALRKPGRLAVLLALSALSWFLSALTAYLIFPALSMPVSWIASFLLLIILQVGVSIPSTPGKIGVFQVLCRWTLGLLGVSATLGLAYGMLLYAVVVLFLIVIGALALVWESWQVGHLPTELDTLLTNS